MTTDQGLDPGQGPWPSGIDTDFLFEGSAQMRGGSDDVGVAHRRCCKMNSDAPAGEGTGQHILGHVYGACPPPKDARFHYEIIPGGFRRCDEDQFIISVSGRFDREILVFILQLAYWYSSRRRSAALI